jgi:chromate transporter
VLRLWKKSVVDPFTLGLYIAVFVLHAFSGLLPVRIPAAVLVILSGLAGILASRYKNSRAAGKEAKPQ